MGEVGVGLWVGPLWVVGTTAELMGGMTEPVMGGIIEPVMGGIIEPVVEGIIEPVVGVIIEPVVEGVIEPVSGGIIEPVSGGIIEPGIIELDDDAEGAALADGVAAGAEAPDVTTVVGMRTVVDCAVHPRSRAKASNSRVRFMLQFNHLARLCRCLRTREKCLKNVKLVYYNLTDERRRFPQCG